MREGLLIGSACSNGEIFTKARSVSDDELRDLMGFYDYIEVQPLDTYDFLLQLGEFNNQEEIQSLVEKIIRIAKESDKLVVATSNSHVLDAKDKIYRQIIVNQKIPGGGLHPLNKKKINDIPTFHFRTTREMLDAFSFLDEDLRKEIVITNTNKITDMIEDFKIIKTFLEENKISLENSSKLKSHLKYKNKKSIFDYTKGKEKEILSSLPENIRTDIVENICYFSSDKVAYLTGNYVVISYVKEKL